MRRGLTVLAAALVLLSSAATASGSGPEPVGPLGVVFHALGHVSAAPMRAAGPQATSTCNGSSCAGYESAINRFLTDVAADSGSGTNVFADATQYSDTSGPIAYSSSFGGSYVDTSAFPTNGCSDGVDSVCLTDAQLENEIQNVITAQGWPDGQTSLFFILTPSEVGICADASGSECSTNVFCAYHSGFTGSDGGPVVYAVEPYNATLAGCNTGVSPNGDDADATINTMSHEMNEAITDPWGNAWYTDDEPYGSGEIADLCAWNFGTPLGFTSDGAYNQVINGHDYYLQGEWSNSNNACVWTYPSSLPAIVNPEDVTDHGGWVMHSNTTYTIFWVPNGSPTNDATPTLSGTAGIGKALATSTGSWLGSPTGYEYQWQRCSAIGTSCTSIAGATSSSYTATTADGGSSLRATVSAVNAYGASAYVASAPSDVVPALPAASAAPVVSGVAAVGRTLETTTGQWNTPNTYAYQWLRCTTSGGSCTSIRGATRATYVVAHADGGHRLRARISATNSVGTVAAVSNLTSLVVARPAARHAPHISGRVGVGRKLKAIHGSWNGSPTRFAYTWLRCGANGRDCVSIAHATRSTYSATRDDVGHRLRVRVIARNRAGRAAATSAPTAKIRG